jgi:membrane-bound ClpP family serine protease
MDVDIRIPIGLLFAILGLILVVFGLFSMNDAALYARSLGRNINLWTGLTMLLFGGLMLFFTLRKKKTS